MRKLLCILPLCLLAASWALADDYVDDIYYSDAEAEQRQMQTGQLVPIYNKSQMQPLYFELPVDTTQVPTVDTVALQPEVTVEAIPVISTRQ